MPFKHTTTFEPNGELILWEVTENVRWFYERMTLSKSLENDFRNIRADVIRRQWIASRFILQQLARTVVLEVEKDSFGKPHLVNDHRFISLSHCDGYAAALASDASVGIDVERVSDRVQKVKNRFLNPSEMAITGESDAQLMLAWSAKEAVYKLYGQKELVFKEHMLITGLDTAEQQLEIHLRKGAISGKLKIDYCFFGELVLSWVVAPVNG